LTTNRPRQEKVRNVWTVLFKLSLEYSVNEDTCAIQLFTAVLIQ
jgi:hypothetical protein